MAIDRRDEAGRLGAAFNAMAASLEQTEEQRRAMVSDVAHELRSPLTNLRGHLEAARDGVLEVDDELIASLLDESILLQWLVDDLQQLALADAGKLHITTDELDAAELMTQVAHAHQQQAAVAELSLTVDAPAPAPVVADSARLRQALGNLVANAIQYTPSGGAVTLRSETVDDGTVVLTVQDTGAGIDPEHLPRVFDRFYRIDTSRSRETGGSGLGLAITWMLIEAQGGSIDVASTPNEGSTFTIRFPRPRTPAA